MILEPNERQVRADMFVRIDKYADYDFASKPGYVEYSVCSYNIEYYPQPDGSNPYIIFKPVLYSGTLELTLQIVNQWGADDQIVFDYVIQQLNL